MDIELVFKIAAIGIIVQYSISCSSAPGGRIRP